MDNKKRSEEELGSQDQDIQSEGENIVLDTKIEEDPDYKRIKDDLSDKWLETHREEPLSKSHQDYIYGDPEDPYTSSLRRDTREVFEKEFSDKVRLYEERDRTAAFEKLEDDPKYREMKEKIVERANLVTNKGDNARIWKRNYIVASMDELSEFVIRYPEKSEKYAERWREFVGEDPGFDEDALPEDMKFFKKLAEEIRNNKMKDEQARLAKKTRDDQRKLKEVRQAIGLEEDVKDVKEKKEGNSEEGDSEEKEDSVEQEVETPLEKDISRNRELLKEITLRVAEQIPEEIRNATDEELVELQGNLKELYYFSGQEIEDVLDYNGDDEGVVMVNTDKIVGSVSPKFDDWSTEYDNRKGRAVSVAKELIKGTEGSIDHVFHVDEPDEGVKLKKISGPEGDLFFVVDGSHRVSGAKLVQMQELPAQVENMTNISEVHTKDSMLKTQWETRIDRGLISGRVEENKDESGVTNYVLSINQQVLPWMNLPQNKLIKMTKFYSEFYPGSLDNLKSVKTGEKIPKEALLDELGMNYFLAGRWDEYKPIE